MRSFIKITLLAIGLVTIASCESKKAPSETGDLSYSDSLAKVDSMKSTLLRDTNETDVNDTMPEAPLTEFDKKK